MSNQQALAGGANAQQTFLAGQVELFLFDLKNEATEHGFKADESWNLQIASEEEMTTLKRQYHPVVSLKLQPDVLLNVYLQVKSKLQQALSKIDLALTDDDLSRDDKRHLAAFPVRITRN